MLRTPYWGLNLFMGEGSMTDGTNLTIKETNACRTLLTLNIPRTIIEKSPYHLAPLHPLTPIGGMRGLNEGVILNILPFKCDIFLKSRDKSYHLLGQII